MECRPVIIPCSACETIPTRGSGAGERSPRTPLNLARLTKPMIYQLLGAVRVHTMGWKVWKVSVVPSLVLGSNLGYAVAVVLLFAL